MKIILSIFIFIFFYECKTPPKQTLCKWQKDSSIIKWKIDSNGCGGFRNYERMDSIFKNYNFASKSIDSIKIILGKPNDEWDNSAYHGLKYFYDTHCVNDTLNNDFDKCWIDILFSKNKTELNSLSAACE